MKRMRFIAVVFIVVILLVITVIQSSTSERYQEMPHRKPVDDEERIVVRVASSWGGHNPKADILQQVLKGFMENNPQIEIKNESMTGEDFLRKLKADFASGNAPDIFGIWPGANITSLVNAGKVAELTQVLEKDLEWKESFDKSAWKYVTMNNKIYGLPLEIMYEGLFVNKDLFDSLHIKVPEDFDELKTAVVEFGKHDVIPIAYNSRAEGTLLYQNIVAMLGGVRDIEQFKNDGKLSDCYIKAGDYMKELYELGAFPPDAFNIDDKSRDELFLSKRAAMIVQRSSFIGEVNKRPMIIGGKDKELGLYSSTEQEITVDLVPFPYIKEGKADSGSLIYGVGEGTFYISQAAWENQAKREACIHILKNLTSKDSATAFAEQARMLSAVRIKPPNVYYSGLMKRGQEMVYNTKEIIEMPDTLMDRAVWDNIIVKQFPYMLEGKVTMKAIWEEAMEIIHGNNGEGR